MADTDKLLRQNLEFALFDLPSTTTVRIDFPTAAGAENLMLWTMPTISFGASYSDAPMVIRDMFIQPRRILFEVVSPPALLPLSLQISCHGDFVFGWLQVPENVQTLIATAAQRVRIVGPGYWAVPLVHQPQTNPQARPPKTDEGGVADKPAASKPATSKPPAPTKSTAESTQATAP